MTSHAFRFLLPVMLVTGLAQALPAGEISKQVEEKILAAAPRKPTAAPAKPRKILIFMQAAGFYHSTIPLAARAIQLIGQKTGAYEATITDNPADINPENLKQYDAFVQDQGTGEMFIPKDHLAVRKQIGEVNKKLGDKKKPPTEGAASELKARLQDLKKQQAALPDPKATEEKAKQALLNFVNKDGKGLIGVHAATDCYYNWKEYGEMIGGYFTGHPYAQIVVRNDDPEHVLNAAFEKKGFNITDEIYVFGPRKQGNTDNQPYSREKQRVLLSIDPAATKTANAKFDEKAGKRDDADYAISWIKTSGQGRVFYCSFGHQDHIWTNPAILRHYLDGIQYAIGDLKADATPVPLKK